MNQKGLTLIEILLMVVLIGLVAAALGQLSVVSIKTADAARSRTTANELAKQATELTRSQRDSNPTAFFALSGYYKINSSNNFEKVNDTYTEPSPGNPPPGDYQLASPYQNFYRVIYFDTSVSNRTTVIVKVYYSQRGVYDSIVLQTILSNWR